MDQALNNHRSQLATLAAWAMFSRGLEAEFSSAAQEQLASLNGPATETGEGIRDLRERDWFSIDNDDSRDLDQLSLSEPLPKGGLRVWVAVADVDALVKKGTPIDQHAQLNTTSVYTSARIFPMLPERLSTDLTSLNQDEDRLAMVIEMAFSDDGVLVESSIYRALVRNKAQLAYDAMSAWIDGEGALPEPAQRVHGLSVQLRAQDGLAQKLRVLRRAEGSLEFETFQPRAQFEGERIASIHLQPQNRARQLIEELMIVTNGCTARFLAAHGGVALRRVVRSPERWLRIVDVVRGFGTQLPNQPDGPALEAFLARQHKVDPLRFPDLSLVIVKLMGSGEYVVERSGQPPIGHFGLAVRDYMHSTAPNRRFPDLITLRLLKAALAGERSPYAPAELAELADHCTLQEDAARKVERQMRKSEAALLLHSRVGERFDGVVTGVSDQGTWVRIFEPPVEGRLRGHVPDLNVGKLVRVHLVSTSVERGFVDFALER
ncbi:RNB domain-containing ribonuclease [Hydrogenophaga sp. PAMC20947]|uniref:RNB domain-containing ribonuclease n=1 Tax=Hydrogenophaga sp. PAMC20947 TaxID=2565558 RepID=UPI00109E1DE6|nr:RNB domain-containing ribonuclease [Hydrogenophaga sp. PAMC20947]QCB48140.1 RNB domain-containing ribonuclease [Hydrogenophaga sp. PAMC20947]